LITDGEAPINAEAVRVCQLLIESRILLDAFLIGECEISPVRMAAFHSRGRAFGGLDPQLFSRILNVESFVDFTLRRSPGRFPDRHEINEGSLVMTEFWPFDDSIEFGPSARPLTARVPRSNRSGRDQRLLRELQICANFISGGNRGNFKIQFCDDRLDRWLVGIEGPLSQSIKARFVWPLIISFPADYPYSCPVFRFSAIPCHPNVSLTGRVHCTFLERYHPAVSIASLLLGIQSLFVEPDLSVIPFESASEGWTKSRVLECHFHGLPAPQSVGSPPPLPLSPPSPPDGDPIEIPDYRAVFSPISWNKIPPGEADTSLGLLVPRREVILIE
jgi:ubiquitin-protein ligase